MHSYYVLVLIIIIISGMKFVNICNVQSMETFREKKDFSNIVLFSS